MEYVAIVAQIEENEFNEIVKIGESLGLELIINDFNYDLEVANGIRFFYDKMKANKLVQLILNPKNGASNKHTTSDLLAQQLSFYFINKSDSAFLLFIESLKQSGLRYDKLFFVFASEWENKNEIDRIRLIQCSFDEMKNYFTENNSWYLWLYSLEANSYYPEFWCPLVFEIK